MKVHDDWVFGDEERVLRIDVRAGSSVEASAAGEDWKRGVNCEMG